MLSTSFIKETPKRVNCKQCRPRPDSAFAAASIQVVAFAAASVLMFPGPGIQEFLVIVKTNKTNQIDTHAESGLRYTEGTFSYGGARLITC